jgi:hypothetical protein
MYESQKIHINAPYWINKVRIICNQIVMSQMEYAVLNLGTQSSSSALCICSSDITNLHQFLVVYMPGI